MTIPAPLPETILSYCARLSLAQELDLASTDLDYSGMMSALGYLLVLFNVTAEGPLKHSTRSVKVPYDG